MIDLLLINPQTTTVQNKPIPFSLAYLASYLGKNNFKVKILDLTIEQKKDDEIIEYIKKINPNKIGISCMSVHVDFVKRITQKIKKNFSNIQIILGGIHPTALINKSIEKMKDVDIFVIGEGELTLLDLMNNKNLDKIKGIAYKDGKRININSPREFIENLDEIPFPSRNLLPDIKNYTLGFDWEGRKPAATIFSSRGCPFNCIYCASKVMWKRKVRFRSAKNVLEEIDYLTNNYKIKEVLFYDDHFTLNKQRLLDICNGLIKRNYDLTWCCLSRVDSLDLETTKLMKKSGCHMISFGVESGSQTVLDAMNKNVKVENIINVFKICKQVGINTKASFIFGGPKESYETVNETQEIIKKILPDYVWFFMMTPMPGTELYKLHEETGINSDEWSMYDQTTYNRFYGTDLTYNELNKIIFNMYKKYYFSFRYIYSQFKKLNNRKLKAFFVLFRRLPYALKYIKKGRKV